MLVSEFLYPKCFIKEIFSNETRYAYTLGNEGSYYNGNVKNLTIFIYEILRQLN